MFNYKNLRKSIPKGFTLIELLVVVLIIGILAAIVLPKYMLFLAKSRTAESFTILKALKSAQNRYALTHNALPETFSGLDIVIPGEIVKNAENIIDGKNFRYILSTNTTFSNSQVRSVGRNGNLEQLTFHLLNNGSGRCFAAKNSSHYKDQVKICLSLGGERSPRNDTSNHEAYFLRY